ncbi:zinc finger protein interacting with ribonucleoprotein K-like isoform X2 [Leptotrombidium deliense]|uniref:Zinc finger protein interacting with ribonucleoprotein K-like isoform X2 n=1 Tax=Leptotrombidium deliense TaxID=299467 RepID=A0A443S0F5_9ACAR|nr:zinc finger protein interacting with ribonucleoprotein K-like isoform X2 [Leptotrombidium deliense]
MDTDKGGQPYIQTSSGSIEWSPSEFNKEDVRKKSKQLNIANDTEALKMLDCHLQQSINSHSDLDLDAFKIDDHFSLKTINGTEKFKCKHCQKLLSSKKYFRAHIRTVHDELYDAFACKLCQRKYMSSSELLEHVQSSHRYMGKSICNVCQIIFRSAYEKINHSKRCHQINPNNSVDHKRVESEKAMQKNELECEDCSKIFTCKTLLNFHLNKVHDKY